MNRICLLVLISVGLMIACQDSKKADLPNFELLMLDSSSILKTASIPKGQPIILVFFSPDCEHCQAETTDILKKIDSLKNVHFYFATVDPFDRMRVFNEYFNLSKYPNITLGRDVHFAMLKYFDIKHPPYTVIYNKEKKMEVVFEGEVGASDLIKEVNNL